MILEEENPLQLPSPMAEARKHHKPSKQTSSPMTEASGASRTINRNCKSKKQAHKEAGNGSSWGSLRDLFSYRYQQEVEKKKKKKSRRKIGCSVSLCRMRDSSCVLSPEAVTAQVNKKLALSSSCNSSSRSLKAPCNDTSGAISTSFTSNSSASITASSSSSSLSSSLGGSFGAMNLRGFSGCYECHLTADPLIGPSRDASTRLTISPCPDSGEIFMKPDDLELHQTAMHAASELSAEDTSRKIIEIIFRSSWLDKQAPICKIDRILKVHNTQKTISRFEDYRDSIKSSCNRLQNKHPRCVADGNELLRFHCTTLSCSLGLDGSTNLCRSIPRCSVCSILRDGFGVDEFGKIQTMATSGGAHAAAQVSSEGEKRAMLVCRVIAGRVKKSRDATEEYDSVAGPAATHSNLDELFVFHPNAILPCFVVLYRGS
ncbi:uncharacterized protein LOC135615030 isoform X1 [Musa acuminata AAA Group]|uniref:uncharacterized protein LOC135615030 isoform X1 n=1 Tax=Musa acuminata AAA Group TaxID=214697 RepID=UPI0031E2CE7C